MKKGLQKLLLILIVMIVSFMILTPSLVMAADNPTLKIGATTTLSGKLPESPEDFIIKLSADEPGNPMPEGSIDGSITIKISGADTESFPEIVFDRVGIYHYSIDEIPGLNPDITYDSHHYKMTVSITSTETGELEMSTAIYEEGDSEKLTAILFNNSYVDSGTLIVQAKKTLDNEVPKDERFSFILTNDSGEILQRKTNIADQIMFDEILFDEEGEIIFFIKEEQGSELSVVYDQTVYKVIVDVFKNTSGDYDTSISYEKDGQEYKGVPIFANKTKAIIDVPKTGEITTTPIVIILIIIALAAINALIFIKKKEKEEN